MFRSYRSMALAIVFAAMAFGCVASQVFAQGSGSANVSGVPGLSAPERVMQGGTAPRGYVSPQDRVRTASGANTVTTPSGIIVQLPAGTHPNSIAAQSFIAKAEREAGSSCVKKPCVPVVGRTADNKYPVYDLQGEPGDLNYISPKANTVFQPSDLYGRMGYVADVDAHAKGMRCDYVCKNSAGQIVGIDPEVKKFDPFLAKAKAVKR